ncbi:MAG: N-acetylmuramoyl-L-alanine amidase [Methylovulum sp.]|nr:N-acetylmuramoyl-L-alanine amidase [Methylovulum sp.]
MSRLQIIALAWLVWSTGGAAQPLIVLDAGHEPSRPGATARCRLKEVAYNDAVVAELAMALSAYRVILTRTAQAEIPLQQGVLRQYLGSDAQALWDKNPSLLARAALANEKQADLFISIHHDSTAERHQISDPQLCGGQGGEKLHEAFKRQYRIGFNIFIDNNAAEPRRSLSLRVAKLIGKRLRASGRVASDYHDDDCLSCRMIDGDLGLWHQDLAVLRHTRMPAVLIEVGNLIDVEDETFISTAAFRRQFADLIKSALAEYFATHYPE